MMPGIALYVYLGSLAGDVAAAAAGGRARTPWEWALYALGFLATLAVTVYVDARWPARPSTGGSRPDGRRSPRPTRTTARCSTNVHPPDWVEPDAGRPLQPRGDRRRHRGAGRRRRRGRPRRPGGAGRARAHGRRLPQRRLRAVEGAPARGARLGRRAGRRRASASGVPAGARVDFAAVMERMRAAAGGDQPGRLRRALSRPRRGRLPRRGALHRPRHGRGRRAPPCASAARVIATGARAGGPAHPRAGRGRLPHQRDGVRPHRAAAAAGRDRRRAHRLRAGPGLRPLRRRRGRSSTAGRASSAARTPRPRRCVAAGAGARRRAPGAGRRVTRVERRPGRRGACCTSRSAAGVETLAVDAILVGAGRAPNVEGLGLEAAGVAFDAAPRRARRRPAAHHQPADLRRRRRLLGATSSPTPPTSRRASSSRTRSSWAGPGPAR